ncbi:SEC-C domain-containing protein [candidate division KSB1 bacterium]|nr:SEC-C domain-containing protein [candidate division KSB1 bacterium]
MKKKIGRNDPCHCGSGEKLKNCHGRKSPGGPQWLYLLLGVIVVLAGVVIVIKSDDPSTARRNLSQPGPTPPGKVWSPEHGHWHDAPGAAGGISVQPPSPVPAGGTSAQPPGPAPPGKVWSPEHGHWHDAPGAAGGTSAQPPGPAPPGKVWSSEHGHWHDAPPQQ